MSAVTKQGTEDVRLRHVLSIATPELFRGEIGQPGAGIRASGETQKGVSGTAGFFGLGCCNTPV